MVYTLYTPGHGLVADSLVLHGILRILAWCGINKGKVSRFGERFVIELEDSKLNCDKDIIYEILEEVLISVEEYLNVREERRGHREIINVSDRLSKINYANINKPVLRNWLSQILDSVEGFISLQVYKDPNHKDRFEKSRKGGGLATLYLPLSAIYGKYVQEKKGVSESPYKVCDTCFITINMGLLFGTHIVRVDKKEKSSVYYTTFIAREDVDINDLLLLQRMGEGYHHVENGAEIPLISAPLIAISQGETIASVEDPYKIQVLTWSLQLSNNFQRSLGLSVIDYEPIYRFVAEIKLRVPTWPRFLNECLLRFEGGEAVLASLTETLLFGGDIYVVSRMLSSHIMDILKKENEYPEVGKLCKIDADEIVRSLQEIQG
ncbi:CRISPR-associated protein, MJ0385 [Desulfurococcaceae archaeon AG1]|nr:CRISPR-associated protein, MJ0385 [Desulfurococcaceae archaeon AG1]